VRTPKGSTANATAAELARPAVRAPHAELSARGFDRSTQQGFDPFRAAGLSKKIGYVLSFHSSWSQPAGFCSCIMLQSGACASPTVDASNGMIGEGTKGPVADLTVDWRLA
jgi:hypothetical protein